MVMIDILSVNFFALKFPHPKQDIHSFYFGLSPLPPSLPPSFPPFQLTCPQVNALFHSNYLLYLLAYLHTDFLGFFLFFSLFFSISSWYIFGHFFTFLSFLPFSSYVYTPSFLHHNSLFILPCQFINIM